MPLDPISRASLLGLVRRSRLLLVVLLVLLVSGLMWPGVASATSSYGAATWGSNVFGELGVGTSVGPEVCGLRVACSRSPIAVAGLSDPIALGAGEDFECAVISGGSIECWGENYGGNLGDGTETGPEICVFSFYERPCSRTPVRVSGITNATAVAGGVDFACALLETHSIDCWGDGYDGELGDGSTESSLTPVQVSGISNAVAIAVGEVDACAVLSDHAVKCWGDGSEGALGDESTESSSTPVQVSGVTTAVAITAADSYVCAVLESREVRCWGNNTEGELGDGKNRKEQEYSDVPVVVSEISTASSITASLEHTCAVLESGEAACWGDDEFGDLGDGRSFEESTTPVTVTGISTATQLAAGSYYTCALLESGGVDCWGDNSEGQLGNGSTTLEESSTPVVVSGLTGATAIAAYESTTIAYGPSFPIGEVLPTPDPEELFALENPGEPSYRRSCGGDPVNCSTGNLEESQTDLSLGGRGIPLALSRTYNGEAAASGKHGLFGYGWSSSFSDHLAFNAEAKTVTVVQANGSAVTFEARGTTGVLPAPRWVQAKLVLRTDGTYTYTLPNQEVFTFDEEGRLLDESDRNGNTTTMSRDSEGRLESVTDAAGRKLTFAYNFEGLVESVTDPLGHVVKYTYEGGNLASVTEPGESTLRWQFKYDGSHDLTEMTDGRGGKAINEYNGAHEVIKQEDPAGHKLKYEYESCSTEVANEWTCATEITNESTGSVTSELFTSGEEPESITRGYGKPGATTESFVYNGAGAVTSAIDGNHGVTKYTYDDEGDRTSETNPDGDETKWTYDSRHDVLSTTTPQGETTTTRRDSHGNPEVVERAAPDGKTQIAQYHYNSAGELESFTDPLEHTWTYEYDAKGDRITESDPEGDRRTWEYNEDAQEIATISPRGNAAKEPSKFETTIDRDAQGRPVTVTDPLGNTTKYTYDNAGNVKTVTDGNGHTTTYTYNGDNQQVRVEEPNKTVTEIEYDGAGRVIAQSDGNKHKTSYRRSAVGEVVEVEDPLGHITTKEYDAAGNLIKLTDPLKRMTTYTYDPANRLTKVSYSSGHPATVAYEYNKDGRRTKMTDGTGTTTYTYDQLGRLTESEDGHKDIIKYEYNLGDEQTKITYPNGKAVTRAYDKDGRLEKVTDWSGNSTEFTYDRDSNVKKIIYPGEPEDKYTYNHVDELTKVKMVKGAETLATLGYTRDSDGQVKKATTTGLPGPESAAEAYDETNRLIASGSTEYEYDAASNPTKIGSSSYKYDAADELESGGGTTYTYNAMGERMKTSPGKGPATTYGYDQAGSLVAVQRPEEGETASIEDTYTNNGEQLRASETANGTTSYLDWDTAEELPVLLGNGGYSFIYGPGDAAIEQINNSTGAVEYLHHDQQGSTRLLTDEKGEVVGKCSYSAYGTPTCEGSGTTPLGYDGQYTNSDTGLIYLRARVYDPATAQFLSVDPLNSQTHQPYTYAGDNPIAAGDPSGMCGFGSLEDVAESFNPFSSENCAYQGAKALVEAVDTNASTISLVTAAAAGLLALTPAAPLSVALLAVSSAAAAYAAGQEAANGEYLAAALDGLGSLLGGTSAAERVLAELESLIPKIGGESVADQTRALARALDKLGYVTLAASILNSLGPHHEIRVIEGGEPEETWSGC